MPQVTIGHVVSTLSNYHQTGTIYVPTDAQILGVSSDPSGYIVVHFMHDPSNYGTRPMKLRAVVSGSTISPDKQLLPLGIVEQKFNNYGNPICVFEEV